MLTIQPLTDDDWALLAMHYPQWAAMTVHVRGDHGEAWSGWLGAKLLGAAGFIFHAPQQAYCWGAFLVERWPKVPRHLLAALRTKRDEVIARRGLVRLEARADAAHIAAARFLEALEFRCEGLMQCTNQYGEAQFLYAYVTSQAREHQQRHLVQRYGPLARAVQQARVTHVHQALQETLTWCP